MQVILTMMTNDNDSVVHDYGDDGNDADHPPPCARGPPPWRAGEPERLGNQRRRWFIMMMITMMMAMIMMMEDDGLFHTQI